MHSNEETVQTKLQRIAKKAGGDKDCRFTSLYHLMKLVGYKEWLKANRTLSTAQIMKTTAAKLRGHFAYYGISDNRKSLQNFAYWVNRLLFKWLNRRGKRGCYTWEKFNKLLRLYALPSVRIQVNLLSASR